MNTRQLLEISPDPTRAARGICLSHLRVEHSPSLPWRARWIAATCFISGLAAGLLLALSAQL